MNCLLKSKVVWRSRFKDNVSGETEWRLEREIRSWSDIRAKRHSLFLSTSPLLLHQLKEPGIQSEHFGRTKVLSRQLDNLLHFSPAVHLLQATKCNRESSCKTAQFQPKVLLTKVPDQMAGMRSNLQPYSISHFHADECLNLGRVCRIHRLSHVDKTGELWPSSQDISHFEGPLTQHHPN